MQGGPEGSLRVEALGPHHDRNSFVSGVEPLDRYFRSQAGQDARKNMAAPFVLVLPDGAIGGYYTLSSTGVKLTEFPVDITRKLPRYPLVPTTLLGFRAVRSEIASFAVIVDAKNDAACRFYEHESFLPFPEQPLRLFRSMADIAKLYE